MKNSSSSSDKVAAEWLIASPASQPEDIADRLGEALLNVRTPHGSEKLAAAIVAYADWCGGVHDEGCPEDDTCDCSGKWINDGITAAVNYLRAEVSSPARPQGLTFNDLQATNKQRCETAFHSVDAWKPWDWSNAIAGEVGEACAEGLTLLAAIAARSGAVCNLTKKMARVWPANEFKQNWNTPEDQRISDLEAKLANELADVVIYADLLATRIGRSLGDCVRAKFNAKSNEIGSSVKLAEGAVSAAPPAQEQKEKS